MYYPLIKLRLSIDHGYVLHLRRFRRLRIKITYCVGFLVRWPGAVALVGYFAFPVSFISFFIHFLYIYFLSASSERNSSNRFRRKGRRARSRYRSDTRNASPSFFAYIHEKKIDKGRSQLEDAHILALRLLNCVLLFPLSILPCQRPVSTKARR